MNRMSAGLLGFVVLMVTLGAGCQQQPGSSLPTVSVRLGNQTFVLEVADTDSARQRGLMYRSSLPDDRGMLFVFDDEITRGFWMKNVPFALDIVFLDSGGKVVSIRQMKAFDESTTSSIYPARYAIELKAGVAEKAGIKAGDAVTLPSGIVSVASRP